MLKLGPFIDADIEDRLFGIDTFESPRGYFPDAILIGKHKKAHMQIPVEVELTQKSQRRIQEKFKPYLQDTFYKKVIFAFTSKRLMEHYHNILNIYHNKTEHSEIFKRLVFAYAPIRDFINMDLSNMETIHNGESKRLSEINFYPSTFF
jgi:hypothetical protein